MPPLEAANQRHTGDQHEDKGSTSHKAGLQQALARHKQTAGSASPQGRPTASPRWKRQSRSRTWRIVHPALLPQQGEHGSHVHQTLLGLSVHCAQEVQGHRELRRHDSQSTQAAHARGEQGSAHRLEARSELRRGQGQRVRKCPQEQCWEHSVRAVLPPEGAKVG